MVDTTLTPPHSIDPPFRTPMVDAGGLVTPEWQAWFIQARDRVVALEDRVTVLEPP